MFDLMNPRLVEFEEERRRNDILATIRASGLPKARGRLTSWVRGTRTLGGGVLGGRMQRPHWLPRD